MKTCFRHQNSKASSPQEKNFTVKCAINFSTTCMCKKYFKSIALNNKILIKDQKPCKVKTSIEAGISMRIK